MREKDLTNRILSRLKRENPLSWWYKIPDPSRCPKCGTISVVSKRPFDIVGCSAGRAFAIEVKTVKGKLEAHQEAQLKLHSMAGGMSLITHEDGRTYVMSPNGLSIISENLYSFAAEPWND